MLPPADPAQMVPSRRQTTERVGFVGSTGNSRIGWSTKFTSVSPDGDENQRLPCWSVMRFSMAGKSWS